MPKIIQLSKNLANQIAAGEVVERPASVVKELVENSIDAKATKIKVEILDGGTKKIIISDDGFGIEEEDLKLIGEKYSTSKIKTLDDLYKVLTFGFRGEAIASISSVSNIEIQTKFKKKEEEEIVINTKENTAKLYHSDENQNQGIENNNFKDSETILRTEGYSGYSIKIIGGNRGKIEQISRNSGTKIIVENLFYNTPARLNYLKTSKTEYNHILNYLYEVALAYPRLGFEFYSDSKQIFNFKEKENLKTRIYSVYGEEFAANLLEINFDMIGINISGVISDPKISFPNRNRQNIFVNQRPIKSLIISKAINDAYNRFIPNSSFPAYVLNITVDPTSIDVNVHPRKLEVRFENEQNIFKAVYHSIEEKLNNISLAENNYKPLEQKVEDNSVEISNNLSQNKYFQPTKENYYTGSGTKFKSYSPYKNISSNPNQSQIKSAIEFSREILDKNAINHLSTQQKNEADIHFTKLGKIIGQIHNSYIIVEINDGIKFFDQHALAERIIFEKLINVEKKISSQQLLIGESINLTPIEANNLNDNASIFKEIGFDFEILHKNIVIISSVPDFIRKEDIGEIFIGILEDVGNSGLKKSKTLDEVRNKIFAYTACRSAIKFGNKLNLFEMNKLLNDSIESYSSTCPHGRPVVFEIKLEELKRKYER